MKCKVSGCDSDAMYKAQQVCQKHYFRFMRNGIYEKKLIRKYGGCRSKKYRQQNPAGYQKVNEPDHPLVNSDGYVYEHRFVYYNEISNKVESCELCGNPISWETCHIDHKDEDVTNNDKGNLRALCRGCNVFRGHTPESMGKHILTISGRSMTAAAWARQPGVEVTGATIIRRKQKGADDYDAVYGKRVTHHNTKTKKIKTKYDEVRGIMMETKL